MNYFRFPPKAYWNTARQDEDSINYIRNLIDCHPIIAKMLANRNITAIADIKNFFSTDLSKITPPWKIKDMDKACKRIYQAIIQDEKILIFGDYDADGITSVSILYLFLKPYCKNLIYFIPNREKDGYGFSSHHIQTFKAKGINLIITVDCGSSNSEAIKLAKNEKIDTIVTDHHKISVPPPHAVAVLNPQRKDCHSRLTHLAGVGVVFYLLIQLRKEFREKNFFTKIPEPNLAQFLDLVTIGTIGDMVPLVKENRIFAKAGLQSMRKKPRPSLSSLMKLSYIDPKTISSQDIAFQIAPRLNSPGRMKDATICVEMICSKDKKKIGEISDYLNRLNNLRKEKENLIVFQAEKKIKKSSLDNIIILDSEDWPQGILGTAAAKLTKKFNRPCILFNDGGKILKGSARSIKGFSIFECLNNFSFLFESFGGHDQAAGISINKKNIDKFKQKVKEFSQKNMNQSMLIPVHEAESIILFDDFSPDLFKELDEFEPFGTANTFPLFIAKKIIIESHITIKNIHHKLSLFQPQCVKQNRLKAMLFNFHEEIPKHLSQALIKPATGDRSQNGTDVFIEAME